MGGQCRWPFDDKWGAFAEQAILGNATQLWHSSGRLKWRGEREILDRNLTILIAEDSQDDAFFLERACRKIGLKNPVQILTDGNEVLDYLKAEGKYQNRTEYPFPSVMFIDIKMPRVNGFEVLKWLQEHPECKIIPTIMFSSSEQPEDVERAYQLGVNAYLVKPNATAELEEILRSTYDFWARCAKPRKPVKCV
jgi:CheY-like chemotaxis protein